LLWLGLLPYVLSGQPLWFQTTPEGHYWYGVVIFAAPGLVVLRASGPSLLEQIVMLPEGNIYYVSEQFTGGDKARLDRLFKGKDEDGAPIC
jgi:hypothetical protein